MSSSPILSRKDSVMSSTDDISQLLDLLPDTDVGSSTTATQNFLEALPSLVPVPGDAASSNQSSSSGNSSPEHPGQLRDDDPPTPQPEFDFRVDDVDMWDMLTALDGPLDSNEDNLDFTPTTPCVFARHTACVSPDAWAAAAAAEVMKPITPLKPQSKNSRPKSEKSKGATKTAVSRTTSAGSAGKTKLPAVARQAAAPSRPSGERMSLVSASGSEFDEEFGVISLEPEHAGAVGQPLSELADLTDLAHLAEEDGPGESAEDKRLKRMRRNRESAAMSRNRKKQYVEELEAQVAHLNNTLRTLQSENVELRRHVATVRESLSESPPLLPLPSTSLTSTPSAPGLALQPPLPELALLDDLQAPEALPLPSPSGSSAPMKRAGSPLLGGSAKRASAASLALMSAITFVTLSVTGRGVSSNGLVSPSRSHSPGARMLMSLNDMAANSLPNSVSSLLGTVPPPRVDEDLLWPSLGLDHASEGSATYDRAPDAMLPPPQKVELPPSVTVRSHAKRVTRAPRNSSWEDLLKIEAAEKQLAEAQLVLRTLRGTSDGALPAHPAPAASDSTALAAPRATPPRAAPPASAYSHVYEPSWKDDDMLYDQGDEDEYDAQRYVFCSRAYMFDAAVRRRPTAGVHSSASPTGTELDLPASMPARFRHGATYNAARVPQVTGGVAGNASGPEQTLRQPVVTLLLPSAALEGVRGVDDLSGEKPQHEQTDLMQVQCQVLNASRWVSSP